MPRLSPFLKWDVSIDFTLTVVADLLIQGEHSGHLFFVLILLFFCANALLMLPTLRAIIIRNTTVFFIKLKLKMFVLGLAD